MDEQAKRIGVIAGGAGVVFFIFALLMGWLSTGNGSAFSEADGAVLACYSEFLGVGQGRIREVDWGEFAGTVEGRLAPLMHDDFVSVNETTARAAELLVEICLLYTSPSPRD